MNYDLIIRGGTVVDGTGKVLAREDYNPSTQNHEIYSDVSGNWQTIYSYKTPIPEFTPQALSDDGSRLLLLSGDGNNLAVFSMSLKDGDIQGPLYVREGTDVGDLETARQTQSVDFEGFATINALTEMNSPESVAAKRGLSVSQILG